MSDLTEQECIDRLNTSLRTAIERCENLAKLPAQGPTYAKLREDLELIEGAAQQVGWMRFDMRWQDFGKVIALFHQNIGNAIRSHMARDVFLHFAGLMREALVKAERLRTARTGKLGPILPKAKPSTKERNRQVYVRPSGLIVPASYAS